jgi:hypothetical protein
VHLVACLLLALGPDTSAPPPARAARPAAPRHRATPAATPLPLPTPLRPPAPPGLSWKDADAIEALVLRLTQRLRSGQRPSSETIVVTERQLNSYVNLSLAPKIPPGVSGLELALQQARLAVRAQLDLDRLKQKIPKGASLGMLAFLSGTVPVELSGRLTSANGAGRIELEQATVAGVSLPPSVLVQLVILSTRSAAQPQGIDLLAPFALPWAARQLRLEPGRACVDFELPPPTRLRR